MKRDSYLTISAAAEAVTKIERSEFIALAVPIADEGSFRELLNSIEKRFFDATHHCWAYRLFASGEGLERSSDAGEPSGTAGRPIAMALTSYDLFDAATVVVRYYGGVKLGTGGLARAYREAARQVLDGATKIERYVYAIVDVDIPFEKLSNAYRLVAPPDIKLKNESFAVRNVFTYYVRLSRREAFAASLTDQRITFIDKGLTIE